MIRRRCVLGCWKLERIGYVVCVVCGRSFGVFREGEGVFDEIKVICFRNIFSRKFKDLEFL